MMATLALPIYGGSMTAGISPTADFIERGRESGRQRLQDSYALGLGAKGSFGDLEQVYSECTRPNWDGHGAAPVDRDTFGYAFRFLEALPLGIWAPVLGAEPDGQLTLEWYQSPHRILSVSVSPNGLLHYAALIGASKQHGSEPFHGEVSQGILYLISRVMMR